MSQQDFYSRPLNEMPMEAVQGIINTLINQQLDNMSFYIRTGMDYSSLRIEPEIKPGDLKKHYEPGINRGNIAYETFCKHMERWLQNGTLKIGNKNGRN